MGRREELHKKIIDVNIQIREASLTMKEPITNQREAISELLTIAKDFCKDKEISEALFDLNAEQIVIGTRALQYADSTLNYLESNDLKKFKIYMKKMDDEMGKFLKISNQMTEKAQGEDKVESK